jgi:hypothetical protein
MALVEETGAPFGNGETTSFWQVLGRRIREVDSALEHAC